MACDILFFIHFPIVPIIHLSPIFFIHFPVDRCLGCFHVLAIVNSAVVNTGVHISFQIMFFSRYRGKERKPQSQKTNQIDHMDQSLV